MLKRHTDRQSYFNELAQTSEKYFMPFIEKHRPINPETAVLEIGCGEGGNLMPFAKRGCDVTGIDISEERIKQATDFFSAENLKGHFARENILSYNTLSVERERETVCTI